VVDSVIAAGRPAHRQGEPLMSAEFAVEDPNVRLGRLVEEYFDAVFRAVRRFGAPPSLADDAAQQVFLVVASKLESIAPTSERAFLFGTAFRVAKELRRRASDVPRTDDGERAVLARPDSSPNLEELVDRKRARLVLDDLISAMPDDLRAVFVLYEVEGVPVAEIAEALGIAQGTAASRLRRAREAFEEALARHRAKERFKGERARGLANEEGGA
jgi:RNA polymerase sigma-70 factor (ECF subfamily)